MKLGHRLKVIASMVPTGLTLADIGTDHAYLPIYLVEQNIVPCAIAGDVHQGPYLSAQNAVSSLQLEHRISVRLGNGLEVVKPGEADVVAIAGMGGATIIDILQSCPEVTRTVKRLILQPMIAASLVRKWLHIHGWQIVEEQLVEEEGKLYQIIAAEPGESPEYETILDEIGPLLWQTKHPLLQLHINELIKHLRGVLSAMQSSPEAVNSEKYKEYASRLKGLENKLLCL